MSLSARAGGALLGVAGLAVLVGGSQLPWRPHPSEAALIRLSWRSSSEPVQDCRTATAEELAALPPHMRREKICERLHAPFRLLVRIDGALVRDALLEPAGASGDRPLYVFEEFTLAPGTHRLLVAFEEQREPSSEQPPQSLQLETDLELAPHDIALVSLDASGDRLAVTEPGR